MTFVKGAWIDENVVVGSVNESGNGLNNNKYATDSYEEMSKEYRYVIRELYTVINALEHKIDELRYENLKLGNDILYNKQKSTITGRIFSLVDWFFGLFKCKC